VIAAAAAAVVWAFSVHTPIVSGELMIRTSPERPALIQLDAGIWALFGPLRPSGLVFLTDGTVMVIDPPAEKAAWEIIEKKLKEEQKPDVDIVVITYWGENQEDAMLGLSYMPISTKREVIVAEETNSALRKRAKTDRLLKKLKLRPTAIRPSSQPQTRPPKVPEEKEKVFVEFLLLERCRDMGALCIAFPHNGIFWAGGFLVQGDVDIPDCSAARPEVWADEVELIKRQEWFKGMRMVICEGAQSDSVPALEDRVDSRELDKHIAEVLATGTNSINKVLVDIERMKGNKYSKKVALAEAEKLYPGAPARQSAWDAAAATYGKATLLELTAARRLIAFDAAYESKKR
jgi:hypothetical protein